MRGKTQGAIVAVLVIGGILAVSLYSMGGPLDALPYLPQVAPRGHFTWVDVNGQRAPQEFPPGSGTTLTAGLLHLSDSSGASHRFTLGFTFKPAPKDSARSTSHGGTFRVSRGTLYFTNDGQEGRPPVVFTFAHRPGGGLAMTDSKGNVWGYVQSTSR